MKIQGYKTTGHAKSSLSFDKSRQLKYCAYRGWLSLRSLQYLSGLEVKYYSSNTWQACDWLTICIHVQVRKFLRVGLRIHGSGSVSLLSRDVPSILYVATLNNIWSKMNYHVFHTCGGWRDAEKMRGEAKRDVQFSSNTEEPTANQSDNIVFL